MRVKYRFKRAISKDLKTFIKKLKVNGYSDSTIRQKKNYAGIFLTWLNSQKINQGEVDYQNMISFIQYMKLNNYISTFTNRVLLSVRHYYEFLGFNINPAYGINLRGARFKITEGFIHINELTRLYKNYIVSDDRSMRNHVMLGIMIFQGLTTEELEKLEPKHINPKDAKLLVPGGKKTNSRTLDLAAIQLIDLHEYMNNTRARMLSNIEMIKSGRKPSLINYEVIKSQLFFSISGNSSLKSTLHHLFREIKAVYPQVNSTRKIRHNVIANWLKSYGIRKVQYMAGHKYVRSTRRYLDLDLTELTNEVKLFHPMG